MPASTLRVRLPDTRTGRIGALGTIFLAWLWLMAGANLAAPLYQRYAEQFGFPAIVLTTVFATYAVTLVLTLLTCGRVADRLGRRPVIASGLGVGILALLVFAAAGSPVWLYVARALQGIAVGLVSGPATAALVELDPDPERGRPALLAGLAQAIGSGMGPLLAGVLAEFAPAPLHLPFLVGAVVTGAWLVMVWLVPEPGERSQEPWRMQWPRVPQAIRRDFWRLGLTGGLVWASLALYLSVVPSYVAELLSTSNLALIGANSSLACFASALTQVVAQRRPTPRHLTQSVGLLALSTGLVLLVVSAGVNLLLLVLLAAVVIGVGHGATFMRTQDELNAVAPPETRGEISAAFVCGIYAVVGGSVVGVGLLAEALPLTVSVQVGGGVLAACSLAAASWQLRRAGAQPPSR
jgi:MFS family permease